MVPPLDRVEETQVGREQAAAAKIRRDSSAHQSSVRYCDFAGAVAELLDAGDAGEIQHGHQQVVHGRFLGVEDVPAALDLSRAPPARSSGRSWCVCALPSQMLLP